MEMLRRMCRAVKLDKIRNIQANKVGNVQQRSLTLYGHVMGREGD